MSQKVKIKKDYVKIIKDKVERKKDKNKVKRCKKKNFKSHNIEDSGTNVSINNGNTDRQEIEKMLIGISDVSIANKYILSEDCFLGDITPAKYQPVARKVTNSNFTTAGVSARKASSYREATLMQGEDLFGDNSNEPLPSPISLTRLFYTGSEGSKESSPKLASYLPLTEQLYISPRTIRQADKVLNELNAEVSSVRVSEGEETRLDISSTNQNTRGAAPGYYSPLLDSNNLNHLNDSDHLRGIVGHRDPLGLEAEYGTDIVLGQEVEPIALNISQNYLPVQVDITKVCALNRNTVPVQEIPRKSPSNYFHNAVPNKNFRDTSVKKTKSSRKVSTPRKRKNHVLSEIKKLQNSVGLLIPKLSFQRVVKEIAQSFMPQVRFQTSALGVAHEATENYLVELYEHCNLCATHANRKTIVPRDLKLSLRLLNSR